jgi:hypothetical protein
MKPSIYVKTFLVYLTIYLDSIRFAAGQDGAIWYEIYYGKHEAW